MFSRRKGSVGPEKLKKTQPGASEATQIYKIEARIYKMMYIVLVYTHIHIYTSTDIHIYTHYSPVTLYSC